MEDNWLREVEKDKYQLERSIGSIDSFRKERWYKVTSNAIILNGLQAKVWHENGEFHISMVTVQLYNENIIQATMRATNVWLTFENIVHRFTANYNSFLSFTTTTSLQGFTTFTGILKEVLPDTEGNSQEGKYFAFIDCANKKFYPGSYFDAAMLKVGSSKYAARVIELSLHNTQFEVYLYSRDSISELYFVVESCASISISDFYKILHELILVLTYVTGDFPGSELYIQKDVFSPADGRGVISWGLYPEKLESAQFGVIPKLNGDIETHLSLQLIDGIQTLSNMINECLNNSSYKRTMLLMIQARNLPDYLAVVSYAVALESIAKLVYKNNKERMNPISDKNLFQEIRDKLKDVIDQYSDNIQNDEAIQKLKSSIDYLNKPTNADMLTKPFSIYNIPLIKEDYDAIKNRNDFLHGRIPYETGSNELSIIGYRLNFCTNSLIMKYCGYKGAIIYLATLFQLHKDLPATCPEYRIV